MNRKQHVVSHLEQLPMDDFSFDIRYRGIPLIEFSKEQIIKICVLFADELRKDKFIR